MISLPIFEKFTVFLLKVFSELSGSSNIDQNDRSVEHYPPPNPTHVSEENMVDFVLALCKI